MTRAFSAILGFGLILVAGCTSSSETAVPDPYALSERALRSMADRLAAPAPDSAAAAQRAQYAARRMHEIGLMPAFASSFFAPFGTRSYADDLSQAHLLGYIPGRNPSRSDELVIVTADLNETAAAAVLETARRLALEALDTQVPERTVLVALWGPPHTGPVGTADFLSRPTWALGAITKALLASADTAEANRSKALLASQEILADAIAAPTPGAETDKTDEGLAEEALARFAEDLYARTRALAIVADSVALPAEAR